MKTKIQYYHIPRLQPTHNYGLFICRWQGLKPLPHASFMRSFAIRAKDSLAIIIILITIKLCHFKVNYNKIIMRLSIFLSLHAYLSKQRSNTCTSMDKRTFFSKSQTTSNWTNTSKYLQLKREECNWNRHTHQRVWLWNDKPL